MRKLIKLLTSEEIVIIFLSLILICCSYLPLAWQYLNPPPGKIFLGSFGFPVDFFGNLISFQEGRLGHWQRIAKITSTIPAKKTFLRIEYLFLGQFSRLFPFDSTIFFHLARLTLSAIFLIVSYRLIIQTFNTKHLRLVAFLLAFFSTAAGPGSEKLMDIWTPLTVFQRTAYYPHYLFSFIFILLALHFLNRALNQKKLPPLIIASIFGFSASLIHPPTTISLYLCFPFYFFLTLLKTKEKKVWLTKLAYLTVFSLISSVPLFYLRHLSYSYPWNLVSKVDLFYSLNKFLSPQEFFFGIGPTAILAFFGAWLAIKKGKDWHFLLAPWAIVYIIGFFFVHRIISANSVRFLQTPFFIVLGILSTFTINTLSNFIAKKGWLGGKEKLCYLLTLLILIPNLPAYNQSLKGSMQNFSHLHPYINASPQMVSAFNWLAQNSQENEIVLASQTNGMLIAAFSGNLPYLTPFAQMLDNYIQLGNNIQAFFSQNWTERQARAFVEKENIKLVFFSSEEKNFGQKINLDWPFLTKVFENSKVIIYRTKF